MKVKCKRKAWSRKEEEEERKQARRGVTRERRRQAGGVEMIVDRNGEGEGVCVCRRVAGERRSLLLEWWWGEGREGEWG